MSKLDNYEDVGCEFVDLLVSMLRNRNILNEPVQNNDYDRMERELLQSDLQKNLTEVNYAMRKMKELQKPVVKIVKGLGVNADAISAKIIADKNYPDVWFECLMSIKAAKRFEKTT